MNLSEVIARSQAGDQTAFTSLVERYQRMAFGYAFSTLGDFHLAEDAVQQAFITAYRSLPKLERPDSFPSWLRGIVRFECSHLRRQRRSHIVQLDVAAHTPVTTPGPSQQAEEQDALDRILAAIHALPPPERDITILFYIQEYSQQEVAAFLNLPVTTINNRLRTARKRLRARGILTTSREVLEQPGLPEDFAATVGQIVRANGLVFDARVRGDRRPEMLTALAVTDTTRNATQTAQVAQYLDNGLVRCITISDGQRRTEGLRAGAQVVMTDTPVRAALSTEVIPDVVNSLRRASTPRVLETGIKVIDLLCPYVEGSAVGFAGDMQAGKMVLVEELIHNISSRPGALSVIVFAESTAEVPVIQCFDYNTSASVQAVYVSVDGPWTPSLIQAMRSLDAITVFSGELARRDFYPAIDPLRSTSRALDPAIIGHEHYGVAIAVRRLLERAEHLQERSRISPVRQSEEDRVVALRAVRIRRFLTQPLFVAETFTRVPGQLIPRHKTISACKAILDGDCDHAPEDTLHMCGSLTEVGAEARPG